MLPFCNNLRKDDPVYVVSSRRHGVVHMTPRETSTRTSVLLEGISTPRYFPVKDLRLVVDGIHEDVPPVDGEIPAGLENKSTPESIAPENFQTSLSQLIENRMMTDSLTVRDVVGILECEKAKFIARWLETGPYRT